MVVSYDNILRAIISSKNYIIMGKKNKHYLPSIPNIYP